MFDKILLPTDGSEFSEHEVERAIKALSEDGEIIILSVAPQLEATTPFQSRKNVDRMNKGFLEEAQANVDHMAERFDKHVNVKKMVVKGIPSETIVDVAEKEDVDLIIIAASGKSGLHRFFIGSVADKVLKSTERDVLLIHN
jgi:nucleotide-binding universal stress UspA family protein